MSNELLYNQLYEKTKEFGRTQFVREIMRLERENNQLKEQRQELRSWLEGLIEECKLEDIIQLSIFHFVLSKLNELEGKNE